MDILKRFCWLFALVLLIGTTYTSYQIGVRVKDGDTPVTLSLQPPVAAPSACPGPPDRWVLLTPGVLCKGRWTITEVSTMLGRRIEATKDGYSTTCRTLDTCKWWTESIDKERAEMGLKP